MRNAEEWFRILSGAAGAAALALALASVPDAAAQAWPAKPVRLVIAFPPGGGTDIAGRLLAKKFTETMGQSFFADNRAGAGGLVGAEIVAKSPPDGYNILVTTASLAVNVNLHKKLGFDPSKDLAPVSWLASVPLMLFVHSSVPARSVKELVALAKKRPDGMRDLLTKDGAEPVGSTPEELAVLFRREVARYGKVIAAAKVQAD